MRPSWRGFACASLLFAASASSAMADTEARFFRIGTAATGGSFFEIGAVVASAISSPVEGTACAKSGACGVPGLVAVAQATQGSVDNLRLVANGQIESGFVQADLAAMAYAGTGAFAGDPPSHRLRAIASLFPEAMHIVVRVDSPIRSVDDLAGKTIAVGDQGSGTAANARVLFAAAGLGENDVVRKFLRPAQAAEELQAGTLDALILAGRLSRAGDTGTGGGDAESGWYRLPAASPRSCWRSTRSTARRRSPPGSTAMSIPTRRRSGSLRCGSCATMPTRRWSTTSPAPRGARARRSSMPASIRLGRQIKLANALKGMSLPLHPGAARFYREQGFSLDGLPNPPDEAPSR